ncbi:MAG: RecX family transcriptional regulator [Clostridia bacterium]|nr:RecX family transcriptional regulator [Clostridia bacterium]
MTPTNNLRIAITALEARQGGDEVVLTILTESIREGQIQHSGSVKLTVASKMLFELGNIGAGSLPYALKPEQYDQLEYSAELWQAVKKGLDLLSYIDNTRASLITKLRERQFNKDIASDAADYIADMGYIDERRILARAVEQLAGKLYGRSRIRQELAKKGISREILREELPELLDAIDFGVSLRRLLTRKCDFSRLDDAKYRESLYATMYRLGYTPSETRAVIKELQEEYDE